MTNESRYQNIVAMIHDYANTAKHDGMAEKVISDPQTWQHAADFPFYAAAASLLVETLAAMDKKTTEKSRLAALTEIYKNAMKAPQNRLHGFFRSGDRWAICDGARFVRVNSKPESLPEATGEPIDLDRFVCEATIDKTEPATLPSVAEIKATIARLKAEHGKGWTNEPMEAMPGWWCNPRFLLDMVQAMPDATYYKPKNCYAPLYCENGDGEDAMLLPVRCPQNSATA